MLLLVSSTANLTELHRCQHPHSPVLVGTWHLPDAEEKQVSRQPYYLEVMITIERLNMHTIDVYSQGRSWVFVAGGPDNRGAAGAQNSRAGGTPIGTPTNFLIEFVQISGSTRSSPGPPPRPLRPATPLSIPLKLANIKSNA
jgi:hypothetical protein